VKLHSQILVSNDIEGTIARIESSLHQERLVKIYEPDKTFSIEDATQAIEKAYMASEETTIIVLASPLFTPLVQNKLLKVIEEPPPKKEFILITSNKATILPTIRSRLPIKILSETSTQEALGLDMAQLTLESVYALIQTHKRTDATQMKVMIENIAKEAIKSRKYTLDEKTLTLFSNAFLALDLGSPPSFVLTTLLVKLLASKKRD